MTSARLPGGPVIGVGGTKRRTVTLGTPMRMITRPIVVVALLDPVGRIGDMMRTTTPIASVVEMSRPTVVPLSDPPVGRMGMTMVIPSIMNIV